MRLKSRPERLIEEQAKTARNAVLNLAAAGVLPDQLAAELVRRIDRATATAGREPFILLSPAQNKFVVREIKARSRQPMLTATVWAEILDSFDFETCEILARPGEIARAVEVHETNARRAFAELARIGAISVKREGRGARYFVNPRVGSCLAGAERDAAQASAAELRSLPPRRPRKAPTKVPHPGLRVVEPA
jgi:hypothetical protein